MEEADCSITTSNGTNGLANVKLEEVQENEVIIKEEEAEPEIDINVNNVVCSFSTRCHLNLKQIAMTGRHVIYKRENSMVNMKIRRPYSTASIWSSGKITCTGTTTEEEAKTAARRFARTLQKLGFRAKFSNFRIVNVLATVNLPFGVRLTQFSRQHPKEASYEPELHPGVTYRIKKPKATLKIFSTGSITVTAPCISNVDEAIQHIYPLVEEFKMAIDLESRRMRNPALSRQLKNLDSEFIVDDNDDVMSDLDDDDGSD